jgi:hypothetical protein
MVCRNWPVKTCCSSHWLRWSKETDRCRQSLDFLELGVKVKQSHDAPIADIPAVGAGKLLLEEHGCSNEAEVGVINVLIDPFHWTAR